MAKEKEKKIYKDKKIKKSAGEWIFDILNHVLQICFVIVVLFPFLNVLAVSLSGVSEGLISTITVFPKQFTIEAYKQVVGNAAIWRSFANSVFVAGIGAVISVTLTSMAAYPLAFGNFPGKKAYNLMIVITMWFVAGIIPAYMVVRALGLLNSLWALILPGAITAYNTVVLRTAFSGLPKSLVEAARIDGAGEFRILFSIIVPLAKASIAVVALWVVVGHWNSYQFPLLYIQSEDKFTLQQILNKIVIQASASNIGINAGTKDGAAAIGTQVKNATLMFSMLPMIIAFPFVQKYFTQGGLVGSVKE